jgi:hypothetical protein
MLKIWNVSEQILARKWVVVGKIIRNGTKTYWYGKLYKRNLGIIAWG